MKNKKEITVKNGTGKAKRAASVKLKRLMYTALTAAVFILSMSVSVLAEEENPLTILTNFEDFIFGVIKIVGVIMCGWGVVQIGTSMSTHDPSQRAMGILTLIGGLIVALSKQVLTLIGVMG